jgi:iron complex outermembrane recepter protein
VSDFTLMNTKHPSALRPAFTVAAFLVLTWLTALVARAQEGTGTINGRVINKATGEYLRNAGVAVVGSNISTTAGPGGSFTVSGVPAGDVKIVITYAGLDALEETVNVPAGQTVTREFGLTSASYSDQVIELGAFRVSTAREGNAKAIMEQRVAINMKKVIAADAIGNVSEGNVGEFLKLMPGVVMDYVEADTRNLRLRGLPPKYNAVLLDGMSIANAASAAIGTGRAFEFEQLSISAVETVELTKVPTPDQPSNVAGTVNLRTKSAFDRQGRRIEWTAGIAANSYYVDFKRTEGWNDEAQFKLLPNFSLEYSDLLLDGRLGVAMGVERNHTLAAQKHIWFFYNANDATNFTDNNTEFPTINRIWYQDGPKPTIRENAYLRFDYKWTDNLTSWVYLGYNDYDARFYNRSLSFFPGTYTEYSPTRQTISVGRASIHSNQYRNKKGDTAVFAGGLTFEKNSLWVDFRAQYSRGRSNYEAPSVGHFSDYSTSLPNISWRFERSGRGSEDVDLIQLTGADWRNPTNYTFDANSIAYPERWAIDDMITARLDFRYKLDIADLPTTWKWGAWFSRNTREVHNYNIGYSLSQNPNLYREYGFMTDWGVGGNTASWAQISPWALYKAWQANPGLFTENALGNLQQRLQNNWDFDEDIQAAYLQTNFNVGKLEITPGLRYEHTESSGAGTRILRDSVAQALAGSGPGTEAFVRAKYGSKLRDGNSYDALLKYLFLNYKFSRDFVARFSYHTAITRADLSNLVPGVSGINETGLIVTASNPDLKEERSENINVSLEYYLQPVGMITLSAFQSKVKDRQATNITPLGASGFDGDTNYANWQLNTVQNIGNALKYNGLELDYSQQLTFLPGSLRGLGVYGNYSLFHYEDRAFFIDSPTWVSNLGMTYSLGRFTSRVNGNWVGKRLMNPGRTYNLQTGQWTASAPFAVEYQADRLQFDLNLEYKITNSLTLFLDGRNILNEPSVYTYRGSEDNFIRILRTGGIWMVGVKGRF